MQSKSKCNSQPKGKVKANMKKTTKICLVGGAIALLLIVLIIGATFSQTSKCDQVCKYGTEATKILEKYKDSDITALEAKNRIDKLVKEIKTEENKGDSDSKIYHRLFEIRMALVSMQTKLMATGNVPYYEVNEIIEEIKNEIAN